MPTSPATAIPSSAAADLPVAPKGPSLGALLTVSEVATYLRVSEMTIYRLISSQQIGATRIGRGYRIPATDLARYVDDGRIPVAS